LLRNKKKAAQTAWGQESITLSLTRVIAALGSDRFVERLV
jgi:hypothetical protein